MASSSTLPSPYLRLDRSPPFLAVTELGGGSLVLLRAIFLFSPVAGQSLFLSPLSPFLHLHPAYLYRISHSIDPLPSSVKKQLGSPSGGAKKCNWYFSHPPCPSPLSFLLRTAVILFWQPILDSQLPRCSPLATHSLSRQFANPIRPLPAPFLAHLSERDPHLFHPLRFPFRAN